MVSMSRDRRERGESRSAGHPRLPSSFISMTIGLEAKRQRGHQRSSLDRIAVIWRHPTLDERRGGELHGQLSLKGPLRG